MNAACLSHQQLRASETAIAPVRVIPGRLRGCLLYPNSYYIGMSSLAVHALYTLLNGLDEVSCERAFMPATAEIDRLRHSRQPLCSVDSDTALGSFDLLAVTTSFELDWLNLPLCLELGGISALRRDRGDEQPFLLGGGPCFTANPAPVLDLFDAVYIGEIEPGLPHLQQMVKHPRSQWAEYLAECPGFLVPGLSDGPGRRQYAPQLDKIVTATAILTPHTEFESSYLIEMSRGCGRGCSFCLAGQIYRPVRNRRTETLLPAIERALTNTRRIGLVGASVSDYPWLEQLCQALMQIKPLPQVSVSSMRADGDSRALFELLAASGQQSVTFAPETGTETLRQTVCKHLSDEALYDGIAEAVAAGLTSVKLYFLLGLPGETEHDRAAISSLVGRVADEFPDCSFTTSISPFVPKPHTALQAAEVPDYRAMRQHLAAVGSALRKLPRVQVRAGSARWAAVQTAISRGDSRLGRALVAASVDQADFSDLRRLFAEAGTDLDRAGLPPAAEDGYPWEIIEPHSSPSVEGGR